MKITHLCPDAIRIIFEFCVTEKEASFDDQWSKGLNLRLVDKRADKAFNDFLKERSHLLKGRFRYELYMKKLLLKDLRSHYNHQSMVAISRQLEKSCVIRESVSALCLLAAVSYLSAQSAREIGGEYDPYPTFTALLLSAPSLALVLPGIFSSKNQDEISQKTLTNFLGHRPTSDFLRCVRQVIEKKAAEPHFGTKKCVVETYTKQIECCNRLGVLSEGERIRVDKGIDPVRQEMGLLGAFLSDLADEALETLPEEQRRNFDDVVDHLEQVGSPMYPSNMPIYAKVDENWMLWMDLERSDFCFLSPFRFNLSALLLPVHDNSVLDPRTTEQKAQELRLKIKAKLKQKFPRIIFSSYPSAINYGTQYFSESPIEDGCKFGLD